MNKFWRWLWNGIKTLWEKATSHVFWAIGMIFMYGLPLYMLAEKIVITQEYTLGWKINFVWLIIAGVLALKMWGWIKNKINTIQPKSSWQLILQLLLMIIHNGATLAVWYFLLNYLAIFINDFKQWYLLAIIPMGIGVVCFIVDKIITYCRAKKRAKLARNRLKEEILGEIANGQ